MLLEHRRRNDGVAILSCIAFEPAGCKILRGATESNEIAGTKVWPGATRVVSVAKPHQHGSHCCPVAVRHRSSGVHKSRQCLKIFELTVL